MTPDRFSGRSLRAAARLTRIPVLRSLIRATTTAMIGLDVLRRARIGADVPPFDPGRAGGTPGQGAG